MPEVSRMTHKLNGLEASCMLLQPRIPNLSELLDYLVL